ncbi:MULTISPECIES: SWIM zinc finger family protein [Frankia]|nr:MULTISPECIES: SWIM zinc finger family protein [Frankia]
MSLTPVSAMSREAVLTLAPDSASARAGERLGSTGSWSGLGMSNQALWGACRGSGATPYRVVVLAGAEFASSCTCPSRKFPCKHALGLLFLACATPAALATGDDPPDWAADWLARRAARAARAASPEAAPGEAAGTGKAGTGGKAGASRATSAARTQARRDARVDAGVAELSRWLVDLAHGGLGAAQVQPASWWEATAARMVDAQAPGLAEVVRDMARIAAAGGPDWPARLTDRLGRLYLLCEGWSRRGEVEPALVDVVRDRIGFSRSASDVLAGERLAGPIDVLGERRFTTGKLQGRRQWLRVAGIERLALLVSYGSAKEVPPPTLPVLTRFQGEVAAYPGRRPTRVALAETTTAPQPLAELAATDAGDTAGTWQEALAALTPALAADPWADPVAFIVRQLTVLPPIVDAHDKAPTGAVARKGRQGGGPSGVGARWLLRDRAGQALALTADAGARWGWHLLALGGGHPLDLGVEWDGFELVPLAAMASRPQPGTGLPARTGAADPGAEPPVPPGQPACPRPTPGWSSLVDAAVVGSARAAVPVLPDLGDAAGSGGGGGGSGGGGGAAGDGPSRATALLRTAALASCARRAGLFAADARALPAPAPAPPERAPTLAPHAARIVEGALDGSEPAGTRQYLELMAEGGWRVPDLLLAGLLSRGLRDVAMRAPIARVLGERGRWLAGLHPDGRWVSRTRLADWPTASALERRTLVQELRQRDPAAAVTLLRGPADDPPFAAFDAAGAAERLAFCEALRVGLGPWDVDLLDHALDDRREDIRRAAVEIALLLPGSGLQARAEARTEGMITSRRGRLGGRHHLEITLPAECSDEMRRDGISDTDPASLILGRATAGEVMFVAELARVDPTVWTRRTGLTPKEFLDAGADLPGARHPVSQLLSIGLLPAVLRHGDPGWVAALLPHVGRTYQGRLLACLAEPARTQALTDTLRGLRLDSYHPDGSAARDQDGRWPDTPVERITTLLTAVPGPWSEPFSRAVWTALTALSARHYSDDYLLRELIGPMAWALHPDTDLGDPNPDRPRYLDLDGRTRLTTILGARRRLRAALTDPPPADTAPTRPVHLPQEGPS